MTSIKWLFLVVVIGALCLLSYHRGKEQVRKNMIFEISSPLDKRAKSEETIKCLLFKPVDLVICAKEANP